MGLVYAFGGSGSRAHLRYESGMEDARARAAIGLTLWTSGVKAVGESSRWQTTGAD